MTESRKRYVDFTDPFLENQLAAIIRREDADGLRTLDDLVTLNEITQRTDVGLRSRRSVIAYGTYRTGSTFYHLSRSRDPVAIQMHTWMVRHPEALVTSAKEGFDRVNAGRYAFIVESTFAEYLTGIYCNLTMLYDTRSLYPRQFAIALPKGSPYLPLFNRVIHELKADGSIQQLQEQYWNNRCAEESVKVASEPPIIEQPSPVPPPPPTNRRRPTEDEDRINSLSSSANAIKIEWAGNGHSNRKNVDYDVDIVSRRNAASTNSCTLLYAVVALFSIWSLRIWSEAFGPIGTSSHSPFSLISFMFSILFSLWFIRIYIPYSNGGYPVPVNWFIVIVWVWICKQISEMTCTLLKAKDFKLRKSQFLLFAFWVQTFWSNIDACALNWQNHS